MPCSNTASNLAGPVEIAGPLSFVLRLERARAEMVQLVTEGEMDASDVTEQRVAEWAALDGEGSDS